ncbi:MULTISPECIES: HGxxPAAW family protein [Arthrobacter]|uniref:HGxxPAAW family protein n=1 Tax=Arthrobacter methylotrophus TaxID=121291 RepID=A0ABV5UTD2_9MICC|nr:HGxxPAAW family protein [Arthrobacter sp. MA-N2]
MSKTTVSASKAPVTAASHSDAIGHGNSPAAWTCVIVMLVGALVSSVAFVIASTPIFIAGIVVMVVGLIAGWAMRKAGYGVDGSKLKNAGH